MSRHYLTEDIAQIKRYFPGAHTVALRTPFDITPKPRRVIRDVFRQAQAADQQDEEAIVWMTRLS